MAIETPDLQKVKTFLDEKWKGQVICPICKDHQWTIWNHVVNAPIWGTQSGDVYPMVVVYCKTCSYSLFFNAISAGALRPDPPKSQGGQENG